MPHLSETTKAVTSCSHAVIELGARRATKYLSPTMVVKATDMLPPHKRERSSRSVMLTVGKPNYNERRFLALCKKAGEPVPVKKVQIKWWPEKQRQK